MRDEWDAVLIDLRREAEWAADKYGPHTSTHEALGVLIEEVDELKAAIRANDREAIGKEALQVAAVAFRLAVACRERNAAFEERSSL